MLTLNKWMFAGYAVSRLGLLSPLVQMICMKVYSSRELFDLQKLMFGRKYIFQKCRKESLLQKYHPNTISHNTGYQYHKQYFTTATRRDTMKNIYFIFCNSKQICMIQLITAIFLQDHIMKKKDFSF